MSDRRVYEVSLVLSVFCESEFSARLTVENWLKEQQKRAPEIDMIHDLSIREPR